MSRNERAGYEIFIHGETIDLVVPNRLAVERDGWHRWFNDPEITRYSNHGIWPNTQEKQHQFMEAAIRADSGRLVLLMLPRDGQSVVGVVSLSSICKQHSSAEIAMVIGEKKRGPGAIFQGLEAKARLAEHAFSVMGLKRVSGGQARPLSDWQRYQALFGFRVEGVIRNGFHRGVETHDVVITSCLVEDYLRIRQERVEYWPGKAQLLDMMRQLPAGNPVDLIDDAIRDANEKYFSSISFQLPGSDV